MSTKKYLDENGLLYYHQKAKATFVAQETGKGLSTNDYTTTEKNKLAGIANNAQVNTIDGQIAFENNKTYGRLTIQDANVPTYVSTTSIVPNGDGTDYLGLNILDTSDNTTLYFETQAYSSTDKTKLAGIETGAEVNTINGSVTHSGNLQYFYLEDTNDNYASVGVSTDNGINCLSVSVSGGTGSASNVDIYNGAEPNSIDSIEVNGTALTPQNKVVSITVPTNNNQLVNGAGYQTASDVQSAINTAISAVMTYKGSVATMADLPSNAAVGDVYNVTEDGHNYAWSGTAWDDLGGDIDLSNYATHEYVDNVCPLCVTSNITFDSTSDKYVITATAPFSQLTDGQRILLYLNLRNAGELLYDKEVSLVLNMNGTTGSAIAMRYGPLALYSNDLYGWYVPIMLVYTTMTANWCVVNSGSPSYTDIGSWLDQKADAATTLLGYGITDAYTKTEVDGMISQAGEENVIEVVKVNGTALTPDANKAVNIAAASTSAYGVTKLSSSTSSTSTSLAATPSAVKAAYDLANGKQSPATTLAGYGITDAYTKTTADSTFQKSAELVAITNAEIDTIVAS